MSARRLEMEQRAADRWLSLEARVEAVQKRRQLRLVEMKHRLEMAKSARHATQQQLLQKGGGWGGSAAGGMEETKEGGASRTAAKVEGEEDGTTAPTTLPGEQDEAEPSTAENEKEEGGAIQERPATKKDKAGGGGKGKKKKKKQKQKKPGSSNNKKDEDDEDALLDLAMGASGAKDGSSFDLASVLSPAAMALRVELGRGVPNLRAAVAGRGAATASSSSSTVDGPQVRRFEVLVEELRGEVDKQQLLQQHGGGGGGGGGGASPRAAAMEANKAHEGDDEKEEDSEEEDEAAAASKQPETDSSSSSKAPSKRRRRKKGGKRVALAHSTSFLASPPSKPYAISLESLRALGQLIDLKSEAVLARVASSGLLPLLLRLAAPGALPTMEGTAVALHTLHVALHSAEARDHLLGECGGAPLVDLSLWAAHLVEQQFSSSSSGPPRPRAAPPTDPALLSCFSSALSCLTLVVRHVVPPALIAIQVDQVRYLLAAGAVPALAELLGHWRGKVVEEPKRRAQVMKLIRKSFSLLEAIAGFPANGVSNHGEDGGVLLTGGCRQADVAIQETEENAGEGLRPAHPLCTPVMEAFTTTALLANGLPMLSALLMDESSPHGGYDVQDITPQVGYTEPVCIPFPPPQPLHHPPTHPLSPVHFSVHPGALRLLAGPAHAQPPGPPGPPAPAGPARVRLPGLLLQLRLLHPPPRPIRQALFLRDARHRRRRRPRGGRRRRRGRRGKRGRGRQGAADQPVGDRGLPGAAADPAGVLLLGKRGHAAVPLHQPHPSQPPDRPALPVLLRRDLQGRALPHPAVPLLPLPVEQGPPPQRDEHRVARHLPGGTLHPAASRGGEGEGGEGKGKGKGKGKGALARLGPPLLALPAHQVAGRGRLFPLLKPLNTKKRGRCDVQT